VIGRRGPAEAAFTFKELAALDLTASTAVSVDEVARGIPSGHEQSPIVAQFRTWAAGPVRDGARSTIHFTFLSSPRSLSIQSGEDSHGRHTLVLERNRLDETGAVIGTGVFDTRHPELVISAVGYRGTCLPGVPFDTVRGVVPNRDGRVTDDGQTVAGLYVAGWIKRGPTGVVGTNRKDAAETVAALLADADLLLGRHRDRPGDPGECIRAIAASRGARLMDLGCWRRIDEAEQALGQRRGRDRTTLHSRELLHMAAARDAAATTTI
jgi:ferredoxin--NADP+ reductase